MWRAMSVGALASALAGCASSTSQPPDYAAKNRPLEERCARAHQQRSVTRPEMTRADVQGEARAAAARGELDKACQWL